MTKTDNYKNLWQLIKFSLVGVLNTLVDMGVFALLNTLLSVQIQIAQFFAYAAGVANSYFFNSRWTFQGSKSKVEMVKFILLNLATALISVVVIRFFQNIIHIDTLFGIVFNQKMNNFVAKVCTVVVTLAVNFIGSKFWVFRKAEKDAITDIKN
jgi:putative flippase GtrA